MGIQLPLIALKRIIQDNCACPAFDPMDYSTLCSIRQAQMLKYIDEMRLKLLCTLYTVLYMIFDIFVGHMP